MPRGQYPRTKKRIDVNAMLQDAPAAAAEPLTPRQSLLREAERITATDRNKAYGAPEDNFANIAESWNTYLTQRFGDAIVDLRAQDVAHLMILMKMARLATNPGHFDSMLDIAGYAACGHECQVKDPI
jgi:hypothetical protein